MDYELEDQSELFQSEETIQEIAEKESTPPDEEQKVSEESEGDGEEKAKGSGDEPQSKYLGLFEDEEEALATLHFLSEKAKRAEEYERQAQAQQQQQQAQVAQSQIDELDKRATQEWKRLINEGKGDEAFLFMQDHMLHKSAMLNQAMLQQQLGQIAEFERGKQLFLQDKSVADVHENIGQIEALLRQGWSERDAVGFIRSIKAGRLSEEKQTKLASAKRRTRDQSYLEEPTSGKSQKTSKEFEDKLTDSVLDALGF